jgi:hypothetical protein
MHSEPECKENDKRDFHSELGIFAVVSNLQFSIFKLLRLKYGRLIYEKCIFIVSFAARIDCLDLVR